MSGSGDAAGSPAATAVVRPVETAPLPVVVAPTGTVTEIPTAELTAIPTKIASTETPADLPTAAAAPVVAFGRTDEGAFYHGAADAPVTLIDYSDFL